MPDPTTTPGKNPGESSPLDELSEICRDVAAGVPGALDRLHVRLTPGLIRHFGRRLGGQSAVAEELAQQTWIAFWQALVQGKYDPSKSRPSTFLYAVSGNIWLRHMRAVGRARPDRQLDERDGGSSRGGSVGSPVADPADAASEASAIELVQRVLRGQEPACGLSDEERLILRAIARGRTDRELAAELAVAPSTAHARKRVATEKLRRFLESRGVSGDSAERDTDPHANN